MKQINPAMQKTTEYINGRQLESLLVEYFFDLDIGDRVASIRDLSERTNMSVGAVTNTISKIESSGAISIKRKGHMGSYIESKSEVLLWKLFNKDPLVIALGLPMHSRFEGLATAVKLELENAGVEVYLIFIRGSATRIKALMAARCNAVLMSAYGAQELNENDHEIFFKLPSKSWLSGYGVYYRVDTEHVQRPLRVGVDMKSHDAKRITELEFTGQDVELVPITYARMTDSLKKGEIDSIVWNTDQNDSILIPGIAFRPLSGRVPSKVTEDITSAVFVGHRGDSAVRSLLKSSINVQRLMGVQQMVIENEMIPEY